MHLRRRTAGTAGRRTSHSIASDSARKRRTLASVSGLLLSCRRRRSRITPQERGKAEIACGPAQHKRTLNTRPTPAFASGACCCGRRPAAAALLSAFILRTSPLAQSQGGPPAQRPRWSPGPSVRAGAGARGDTAPYVVQSSSFLQSQHANANIAPPPGRAPRRSSGCSDPGSCSRVGQQLAWLFVGLASHEHSWEHSY